MEIDLEGTANVLESENRNHAARGHHQTPVLAFGGHGTEGLQERALLPQENAGYRIGTG